MGKENDLPVEAKSRRNRRGPKPKNLHKIHPAGPDDPPRTSQATSSPDLSETSHNQSPLASSPVQNIPAAIVNDPSDREKLNFMFNQLRSVKLPQLCENITKLTQTISALQAENKMKDKRISELESKVNTMEQYSRLDNLIISGIHTGHRTYARAAVAHDDVAGNENVPEEEKESLETKVLGVLQSFDIPISAGDISTCHTLKTKPGSKGPAPVIIRLLSRKTKVAVLRKARSLKNDANFRNIYINEHLTSINSEIAYKARQLKKNKKIAATWVQNCTVYIKVNEGDRPKVISNIHELDFNK